MNVGGSPAGPSDSDECPTRSDRRSRQRPPRVPPPPSGLSSANELPWPRPIVNQLSVIGTTRVPPIGSKTSSRAPFMVTPPLFRGSGHAGPLSTSVRSPLYADAKRRFKSLFRDRPPSHPLSAGVLLQGSVRCPALDRIQRIPRFVQQHRPARSAGAGRERLLVGYHQPAA